MPLEYYIDHADGISPLLSRLFREILTHGRVTETMRLAILSPIFKNKGETHDPMRYRPISVTTMEYRILAKCIAQRLNEAVPFLIGDPQTGYSKFRTYDENVSVVYGACR